MPKEKSDRHLFRQIKRLPPFFILTAVFLTAAPLKALALDQQTRYDELRDRMVENQIKARGVKDENVLATMRKVKRHLFVPKALRGFAYDDRPLPIGFKQTISQPYIVAYMSEAAGLNSNDRVLEIGTGSGYQAAVLGEIVKEVYSIEIIEELARRAETTLKEAGYTNILIKYGNGFNGWAEHAPFDVIIVTAAPDRVPEKLVEQLAEGGRMVIPIGSVFQELYLITKTDNVIQKKALLPVRFVPMVEGQ